MGHALPLPPHRRAPSVLDSHTLQTPPCPTPREPRILRVSIPTWFGADPCAPSSRHFPALRQQRIHPHPATPVPSLQVYYEKRKRRQEEKAAHSLQAGTSKKERKGSVNNGEQPCAKPTYHPSYSAHT